MSGLLEALVERLNALEKSLDEVHDFQCGCDTPGKYDYCIAKPREPFRLLSTEIEDQEAFKMLEKLLNAQG